MVLPSIQLFLLLLTTVGLLCFLLRFTTKVFWVAIQFLYMAAHMMLLCSLCHTSTSLKWIKHEEACASFYLTQVHAGVCAVTRQRHCSNLKFAWIPNSISKQKGPNPTGIFSGQRLFYSFRAFKQFGTGVDCSPHTWLTCFWSSTKLSQAPNSPPFNPHFTINMSYTHSIKPDTENAKWKWKFV